VLTPAIYSVSTFLSSTTELFLRLPLETVLRRGQVAVLKEHEREKEREAYTHLRPQSRFNKKEEGLKTVVDVGPYKGVLGTMWFIIWEEGVSFVGPAGAAAAAAQGAKGRASLGKPKKGQGVYGLWRGWRVGFWGIVGVWGAAALGGNAGGEF
jgi:mitochondrial fusion and transport protein UGO1